MHTPVLEDAKLEEGGEGREGEREEEGEEE